MSKKFPSNTQLKQTIQKLLTVGIVVVCIVLNVQYIPLNGAVAAVKTDAPSQTQSTHAANSQLADVLHVVPIVNPTVATSTTIQVTDEPSALTAVTLQSASSIAESISIPAVASATGMNILSVQPAIPLFSFAHGFETQTVQEAIAAATVPVRDAALPPNIDSSATGTASAAIAFVLLSAAAVLITAESKGFALADRTTVLRC
jgi:hypothetical protein